MKICQLIYSSALLLALAPVTVFSAPVDKVSICHLSKDAGTFGLIIVGAPAAPAHLAHGDVLAPAASTTISVTLANGTLVTLDSSCAVIVAPIGG